MGGYAKMEVSRTESYQLTELNVLLGYGATSREVCCSVLFTLVIKLAYKQLPASKSNVTMDTPNPSINVKQLRANKKLTLRKIATTLDIAESTVGRWETGINKPHLPLDKVKVLMDLFECDFDTLYQAFEQTWIEKEESDTKLLQTDKKLPIAV